MANDDDENFPPKGASDGIVGDALKKILTTGITAAFMTEEAIRSRRPTLINAIIDETAGTESGRITSLNPAAALKK